MSFNLSDMSLVDILLMAFGLVLVLEGALYSLFPGPTRKAFQRLLEHNPETLRLIGLAMVFGGVLIVYAVKS